MQAGLRVKSLDACKGAVIGVGVVSIIGLVYRLGEEQP